MSDQSPSELNWWRTGPTLVTETFDEDDVVFDPATGETHFLTELPALLLTAIDRQPASHRDIVTRLAGAETELDAADEARVLAALQFLVAAELVESAEFSAN